jgi:hypothetical protein
MAKTTFVPELHGFHFPNGFVNHVKIDLAGATIASFTTTGLCGGMSYAAMDYYEANRPAPTHDTDDFGSSDVPPENTPLANYIFGRQMDAFSLGNATTFVTLTVSGDHSTWLPPNPLADHRGTPQVTKQDSIPALINELEAGRPAVLGMIGASNLTDIGSKNHFVVAYDYQLLPATAEIEISIYDCNVPDQRPVLKTSTSSGSNEFVHETVAGEGDITDWRGFFVAEYTSKTPTYFDLCIDSGLVAPTGAVTYDAISASVGVKNVGAYPASIECFELFLLDSAGHRTVFSHDATKHLASGQTMTVAADTAPITAPGTYSVEACYRSMQGFDVLLEPVAPGTQSRASVSIAQAATPMITAKAVSLTPVLDQGIGCYDVVLEADVQNLPGATMTWQVDGQTLVGSPVTGRVKVGNTASGFTYAHEIVVTAAKGTRSVSTSVHVDVAPTLAIVPNYSRSVRAVRAPSDKPWVASVKIAQRGAISVLLGVRYAQVWVDPITTGTFGSLTATWTPAPVQTAGTGALVQVPLGQNSVDVGAVVIDGIGQRLTKTATLSAVVGGIELTGELPAAPKQPPAAAEKWPHPGEWITHTLGPLTDIEGSRITLTDHTLTIGVTKVALVEKEVAPQTLVVKTDVTPAMPIGAVVRPRLIRLR